MTKENQVHWLFGRHSGIPDCCIAFFTTEWDYLAHDYYAGRVHQANWGYVPCPKCLDSGRQIWVRNCARECGTPHCGKRFWEEVFHDERTTAIGCVNFD